MRIIYYLAALFNEKSIDIPKTSADQGAMTNILKIVFGIIGAVAVLVITIAGLSYITSTGDPQKTAKAKDAILYASIGLVISVLSFAIVAFVIEKI